MGKGRRRIEETKTTTHTLLKADGREIVTDESNKDRRVNCFSVLAPHPSVFGVRWWGSSIAGRSSIHRLLNL
jgi:hypothetical protein